MNPHPTGEPHISERYEEMRHQFLWGSYGWLAAALGLTALIDFLCDQPEVEHLFGEGFGTYFGMFLLEAVVALVLWWVAKTFKPRMTTAIGFMLVFSLTTGFCLHWLFPFHAYAGLAVMFGLMGLYGLLSRPKIDKLRWLLLTFVMGVVTVSGANLIWAEGRLGWFASYLLLIIFLVMVIVEFKHMWQAETPGNRPVHVALRIYLDLVVGFYRVIGELVA